MDPMTSSRCNRLFRALEGQPHDRPTELSDDLALHLDRCGECRREFDATRVELGRSVFEQLSEERRQAILDALASARSATRARRFPLAAAAAAVVAVVLASALYLVRTGGDALATALVEDHIRYLRHPDRHTSDDPGTVVADLQTYLDFPVWLPELPESQLTGGRQCYLLDRRVGLAFYETPAGALSYFVLEADGLSTPGRACPTEPSLSCRLLKGYRVVSWEEAGLLYAMVAPPSDSLQNLAAAAQQASFDR